MLEQTLLYVNINIYTSGVTVNMYLNCVREQKLKIEKTPEKWWIVNFEEKINSTRRKSYHMYLVIQCQQNGTFTKHQLNIKRELQKSTGMLVLEIWTIKKQGSSKN